jgi:hypothetical protein
MILYTCGKCNKKFKPEEGAGGTSSVLCAQCAQLALGSIPQARDIRSTSTGQLNSAGAQNYKVETTKDCPFCGEEIQSSAKKCKHCGEWLETKSGSPISVNEQRPRIARGSGSTQNPNLSASGDRTKGIIKGLLVGLIGALALWVIGSRLSDWGDKQATISAPQQQDGQRLQQQQGVETPHTQSGLSISDAAFLDAAKPFIQLCYHMAGKRQVGINYPDFTAMLGDMVAEFDQLKSRPAPTDRSLGLFVQDSDHMLTCYQYAAERWKGSLETDNSDGLDESSRDQELGEGDKDLANIIKRYSYLSTRYQGR